MKQVRFFFSRFVFYPAVSVLLFLLWSLAIVAYLLPNSQEDEIQEKFLSSSGVQTRTWHINLMDGVFAWPISVSNRIYKSESLLGYALATLALITSASSLMVPTFDKSYSWPWFLLWQAIGGLLAASLGKFFCHITHDRSSYSILSRTLEVVFTI